MDFGGISRNALRAARRQTQRCAGTTYIKSVCRKGCNSWRVNPSRNEPNWQWSTADCTEGRAWHPWKDLLGKIRPQPHNSTLQWECTGANRRPLCYTVQEASSAISELTATSSRLCLHNGVSVSSKPPSWYRDTSHIDDYISLADHPQFPLHRDGEHPSIRHIWIYTSWEIMVSHSARNSIQMAKTPASRPIQQ